MKTIETAICTSDETSITICGLDLVDDIIGQYTFSEMLFFQLSGRFPSADEVALLDVCLVTLMEHGITPSSIITRMVMDNVVDELQVAVAAGLNVVSNVFVGTMQGAGRILHAGVAGDSDPEVYCQGIVEQYLSRNERLPGFGHPYHKPNDPRPQKMLEIAGKYGRRNSFCSLLERLGAELDRQAGRHITINATGATAALLLEAGLDPGIFRGVAVVARAGGLVAHAKEELQKPIARKMWDILNDHTRYVAGK